MSESQTVQAEDERKKDDRAKGGFFIAWLGVLLLLLMLFLAGILIFLALYPEIGKRWLGGEFRVETQRWGDSTVYPIKGWDTAGNSATFDVAVLPQNLSWAHKSTSILAIDEKTMIAETEVTDRVFTAELRDGLSRSTALIAVGLASQEGRVEVETERAKERAQSAAGWLSAIAKQGTPVWMLNLGQFKGSCEAVEGGDTTSWQRPLIMVGVREQSEGVNLSEAFADAISGKTNLPSRDCYTNFDFSEYR